MPRRGAGIAVAVVTALTGLFAMAGSASAATPTVTEFSTGLDSDARIEGITAASDGKLWFADQGNLTAGSINPFNQIISEIPGGDFFKVVGITNGSDGNVYYARTEEQNSVGGIIPATGAFRNTYLGGGNVAWPFIPVTGPEGNVWTTEPRDPAVTTGNDKLGVATPRVDTNMAAPNGGPILFLEPTLTGNADPQGIAAGPTDTSNNPDEALWVAEFTANKIARVQPVFTAGGEATVLTEYTGLSSGAHPEGVALGPDGNIWFTEFSVGKVGRLTPPSTLGGAPDIQEFPLPHPASQPWGIAAGPDGNLWIAECSPARSRG